MVSGVTYHLSHVPCHMAYVTFFGQIGEASQSRVGYQRGLPRLALRIFFYCFLEYILITGNMQRQLVSPTCNSPLPCMRAFKDVPVLSIFF